MKEETDHIFMAEALKQARKAREKGEVPVGAVVVHKGVVIARGGNGKESSKDPTHHAEVAAMRAAAKRLGGWRLSGTTLYVTLEPCLMCMGAIIQGRVPRLVFAAFDPKAGACGSLYDVSKDERLNHRVHVTPGVCEDASAALLKDFFYGRRAEKKSLKKGRTA